MNKGEVLVLVEGWWSWMGSRIIEKKYGGKRSIEG